jgi:hypothetical protein
MRFIGSDLRDLVGCYLHLSLLVIHARASTGKILMAEPLSWGLMGRKGLDLLRRWFVGSTVGDEGVRMKL